MCCVFVCEKEVNVSIAIQQSSSKKLNMKKHQKARPQVGPFESKAILYDNKTSQKMFHDEIVIVALSVAISRTNQGRQ